MTSIRQALADDAREPRFIRTAHRFGYAFCADARDADERRPAGGRSGAEPRLVWGDRVLSLRAGENVLGRDKTAAVLLDAPTVSRSHAELDAAPDLDIGDPADLGRRYRALRRQFGHITVLGGCCGTDHRHVEQISLTCAAVAA